MKSTAAPGAARICTDPSKSQHPELGQSSRLSLCQSQEDPLSLVLSVSNLLVGHPVMFGSCRALLQDLSFIRMLENRGFFPQ